MTKSAFDRIRAGLEDALAHASGDSEKARVRKARQAPPEVAEIRGKLGLTQEQFATLCGVSVATVRNWEQHRRAPRGPSLALLRIVELEPKAALRVARSSAA